MKDRELHDEILASVLEGITGVSINHVTPSTTLIDLDPTIELSVLGLMLQRAAADRGIKLGGGLTRWIHEAGPNKLTITNLRKLVAAAGGDEDFDITWPPKRR